MTHHVIETLEISGNFQCTVTNGTAYSEICRKQNNLARYIQIFGDLLPEMSVPFYFPSWISQSFVWMVHCLEIHFCRIFWKHFSGNYRTICPRFDIFGIFGWMGSAPNIFETLFVRLYPLWDLDILYVTSHFQPHQLSYHPYFFYSMSTFDAWAHPLKDNGKNFLLWNCRLVV